MHVTNEHTCKRTQNHLTRKNAAGRGKERAETHKAFKIHFTLASCLYVSLFPCICACERASMRAHTRTQCSNVMFFNAPIHIYICNCSYNNSNREQNRREKTSDNAFYLIAEVEKIAFRRSAILSFHIILCRRACI